MLSFIIPAHNEEASLPATLQAVHESARAAGEIYEIIVVDDASTDSTTAVARANDATVLHVNHRQIAATRNSGARVAKGDRFFFVDADTVINARAVSASLRAMDNGAVGGGALVKMEGVVPLYARLVEIFGYIPAKLAGLCGGAFMFSTRAAFAASGGFNERMYWGEEGSFSFALKREALLWSYGRVCSLRADVCEP